jgi:hypothetical protein
MLYCQKVNSKKIQFKKRRKKSAIAVYRYIDLHWPLLITVTCNATAYPSTINKKVTDCKLQAANSSNVHVGNPDNVVRGFELASVNFLVPLLLSRKRQ